VADHHLQQRLVRRQPLLHGALQQLLLAQLKVLLLELDVEGSEHLVELVHLVVHAALHDLANGVQDEHVEGAVLGVSIRLPLLLRGHEVVLTPEALSHLLEGHTKLLGVHAPKLGQGEGPPVETGRETDSALLGINLQVFAHGSVVVGRDGHVDVFNMLGEVGVHGLPVELKLEETAVKLVDGEHGLDTLTQRLAKHSLGLHRHTVDGVHNHERAVGDTERRSHLSGEVNVTRRVDEVDEELTAFRILGHLVVGDLLRSDLIVQGDAG